MDKLTGTLTPVQGLSATLSTVISARMQGKTVTPTEELQVVAPDDGYNGLSQVTVNAIPNQYVDTSDADATAQDILQDKTAYVNGEKVTGTFVFDKTKYGVSMDEMLGETNVSGVLALPSGGNVDLVISGFTEINNYVFSYKFYRCGALKSVTFADLQRANSSSCFDRAFNSCANLETASFPALVTANGATAFSYTFTGCTKLKSVSFPSLEEITGGSGWQHVFDGCTALESVLFPSLRVIGNPNAGSSTYYRHFYYAFYNCTKLTELSFPALESIYCNGNAANTGTFVNNTSVKKVYMPKVTFIGKTSAYASTLGCNNIFSDCTALTEIHFGAENRSAIEATTGYATKWGAPSNCQILFDL